MTGRIANLEAMSTAAFGVVQAHQLLRFFERIKQPDMGQLLFESWPGSLSA